MNFAPKKLTLVTLLALSATAVAGCAQPSHDDHHTGEAGRSTMMMNHEQSGQRGMMNHEMMHGDHPMEQMHEMHQSHAGHAFTQDNQRMMQDMHSMEVTGDVDYDFVRGMIPHHQGAIDMAQTLLAEGTDAELLALAEEIIAAQQTEIADMEAWLAAYGDPRIGSQAADIRAGYERTNNRMMRDMNIAPSGDVNRDFVLGMIPHHEAAIDMAYILLRYSDDSELRTLAEAVIREQEREIRTMRAWLEQ
ncbi:MAG: DUF305 domain-containing protein [Natronospirillum sp.]